MPVAGPAATSTFALTPHLFAPMTRQGMLPLPLTGALGFAGLELDSP